MLVTRQVENRSDVQTRLLSEVDKLISAEIGQSTVVACTTFHMEHFHRRHCASIPVRCVQCSRYTTDPRKGLCVACVHRSRRGNQIVLGAKCAACGTTDLRVLRWVKLAKERGVFCANDEARLRLCQPRPVTVAQACELLPERNRDRRIQDRRNGLLDRRIHFAATGEVLRPLGGRRSSDRTVTTTDQPTTSE